MYLRLLVLCLSQPLAYLYHRRISFASIMFNPSFNHKTHFRVLYFLFEFWSIEGEMMMMIGVASVQGLIDLVVAGISLMICLGIFAFIASILCSAAFFHHAKEVSWSMHPRYILSSNLPKSYQNRAFFFLFFSFFYTAASIVILSWGSWVTRPFMVGFRKNWRSMHLFLN